MSTQEQTRASSPRFYRQYIEENDSLTAPPTPASTLPSYHLPSRASPSDRSQPINFAAQAQPSRRSLDIASRVLGIGSSTNVNAAVTAGATPLLSTRPTLTLHLPNGRILPTILSPTSPAGSRCRASSVGFSDALNVGQPSSHGRSVSETIISPTTPVTIVHPPRPPYRNASSDPFPTGTHLSSPIITLREPSPPPPATGSTSQGNVVNRANNIGFIGTNSTTAPSIGIRTTSQGSEKKTFAPDEVKTTDSDASPPPSRSSLEDYTRRTGRNDNHSIEVLAGRQIQLALHGRPSSRPDPETPTPDEIPIQQPPLSPRSSFESTNSSRTRSIDVESPSDVQRLYHRASTQSLQTVKPTLISIAFKESLYNSTDEADLSLESRPHLHHRNHSLDIPRCLLPRPNHCASTQSLQTRLRKQKSETMIVNRFTPLNSHPVSPIAERAYTLSPSWIVNDFPAPEPTAPLPRPECLTITPPPSDIKPPSIPPKIPLDTEPEPTFSRNADYLPLFPSPPQDALPTWGKPGTPGPVQIYLPPTPPDYIAFPWPDHPPPIPPRPQASAQGMLHTRIPSPCLHLTPPMPDYPPPPPQEQFQRLSQTAHASETSALPVSSASLPTPASSILELPSPPTTEARQTPTRPSPGALARKSLDFLRAAPTSAFQPSTTILSAANNNSDASNSSSSSKTSTSTSTIPTPQSPPTSIPSLKDTSNIPLETLTSHAQAQVTQARTLFDLVSQRLTPGENIWINDTISDTETAVREILVLTEGLRVDRQTKNGKLGLKTQFKWMMRDSRKAKEKRERLVLCNASLGGVLVRLQGVYSTLHVNNETAQLEEKAELGPSEPANVNGSTQRPTSTLHVAEPESPPWDLKMELQDAGMEVVVDEPVPGKEERSPSRFETQSPTPTISTGVSMQGSLGSAPSIVTLDHELLDMLSWRWAQGQSMR